MKRSVSLVGVMLLLGMLAGAAYAAETTPAATTATPAATTAAPAAEPPKVEEPKVTGSVGVGVFNRYIFRGYEIGSKSAVVQPGVTVSYRGFSAGFWGNWDSSQHATQSFAPNDRNKSYNETDITLSYTHNIDKLGLTVGYIYYGTKYTAETQEVFGSVTYDVIAHPTLSVYRDIDEYKGTYFNFSLSQSVPVYKLPTGDLTLDLAGSIGYFIGEANYWKTYDSSTGGYTGKKYNALHDGMVKAGVTIPLGKGFTIQPVAQYWFPLSGKAHKSVDGNSYNFNGKLDQTFVYGLNLSLAF
jgi:hypothetical protein